jgi:hypothetical protein|tara:strand:- start:891 stop:1070 length:180 start_codon:yes stop_codon:yes gene_type:complete
VDVELFVLMRKWTIDHLWRKRMVETSAMPSAPIGQKLYMPPQKPTSVPDKKEFPIANTG